MTNIFYKDYLKKVNNKVTIYRLYSAYGQTNGQIGYQKKAILTWQKLCQIS